MTKSTHLLFKQIRWRVVAGMSAAFVLMLFIALNDPPLKRDYLRSIPFFSMLFTLLMGLHSRLSQTLFPVTNRQVAWIPLSVWGLVALAGSVGVMTAQGWALIAGRIQFPDPLDYWFSGFPTFIFFLFFALLLWRLCQINAGYIGFLGLVLTSSTLNLNRTNPTIPTWFTDYCLKWWPLWMAGCVFLVWEAPQLTAILRRLEFREPQSTLSSTTRVVVFESPFQKNRATCLADSLMILSILGIILAFFSRLGITIGKQLSPNLSWILLIVLRLPFICFPVIWIREIWKQARASGMGRRRAALVTWVQMTIVGYLFRDRMGVVRGQVVRCPICRNDRMVWQKECPHCSRHSVESESQAPELQPRPISRFYPRHDPEALTFRVTGLLAVAAMILAWNWQRWFGN